MIKRNGYRINLNEIKDILLSNERVRDCACLYLNENEILVAIVVTTDTLDNINAFLKDKISPHMTPNFVYKMEYIPYTDRGKPDFKKLRESLPLSNFAES